MPRNKVEHNLRRELAYNAAKLIAEDGLNDYLAAKKKAANQLGIQQEKFFPSNKEIEQALIDYQQLFQSQTQPKQLATIRNTALAAMRHFQMLNPYLVGPVLNGTANKHSEIILHIYTDAPEQIDLLLIDQNIPFERCDKRAKFKHDEQSFYPAYKFLADNIKILLIVFPERQKNQSPLDPIDGRPTVRANFQQVNHIVQQENQN